MNKNKIPFRKLNESIKQDIARNFINAHIFINQSYLVDELFEKEIINYDNIHNLYFTDGQLIVHFGLTCNENLQHLRDNGEDQQEIFEYWVCSKWLINKLKDIGEPILETNMETWWGRTCTGQSICLDFVIQQLAYDYSNDKRLFNKKVA